MLLFPKRLPLQPVKLWWDSVVMVESNIMAFTSEEWTARRITWTIDRFNILATETSSDGASEIEIIALLSGHKAATEHPTDKPAGKTHSD